MECPLCGLETPHQGEAIRQAGSPGVRRIACGRCGEYLIGEDDAAYLRRFRRGDGLDGPASRYPVRDLHLVSGHLREAALLDRDPVHVTAEVAANLARGAPRGVTERIDRLLLNLARRSGFGGEYLEGDKELDYPLGYCAGLQELDFFLRHLDAAGLVTGEMFGSPVYGAALTVAGWARVQELERPNTETRQCFVAMSFAPEMDGVFERGIAPAVEEAGYRPLVLSRQEHADQVNERIVLELNRSRFVVADFTGQRENVYFEAGYALGQGKPVIWTCRASEEDALHFDTRQYNYIFWDDEAELRERLYTRIKTMLG
ncbi:MAG TPA: hypothetical protein VFQ76_07070 [Longimicrobiaceae bacterium]|nr:hypothetical protein [Longimicrobiaceae bacterium]